MTPEGEEPREIIYACSTVAQPDCEIALCVECGATVYPTGGSLAALGPVKILCVACWKKIGAMEFAGFVNRGELIEPTPQSLLIAAYLKVSKRAK